MDRRLTLQIKKEEAQPRRLQRRWWVLLTVAFFVLYLLISSIALNLFLTQTLRDSETRTQRIAEAMVQQLAQTDYASGERIHQKPATNNQETLESEFDAQDFDPFIVDNSIQYRVYNKDNNVIYQNHYSSAPWFVKDKPYAREIRVNNKLAYTAGGPVTHKKTHEKLGYVQVLNELENYHSLKERISHYFVFASIAIFFVIVLLSYIISKIIFLPINDMIKIFNQIDEENLTMQRLKVRKGNNEMSILVNYFNELIEKIAFYFDQQKHFIEDVSHELRTPVAIVEGHLKLLTRWGKDDPEVLEDSLNASLLELARMKTLVQEMLDLSRAEQAQDQYKDEETAIFELVAQVYQNFKIVYEDFEFFFDNDASREIWVNIYRNHLEQILVVLLDNAVKYSTDRKEVHLALAVSGQYVQIAVQDFGEGMSEADREKVFSRFYRVDKARSREKGGNGLGLAIAKELVENYGGQITVESVLDQGSVFRVQLPIKHLGAKISQKETY